MLRGRALNVLPQYSKEAEDCLSKAVKLDPRLAEAWSYLGECYWKNNDVESARNCFVGSLSHVIIIINVNNDNNYITIKLFPQEAKTPHFSILNSHGKNFIVKYAHFC